MKNEQSTKQLFKGALLLTIAGLVSKILSAGYRIPLQNITGDLGFYIYQQIYPFLGIAMILSLYGFPIAISKLVSEQKEDGRELSIASFYLPVFGLLLLVNAILFLGLYVNSEQIASWMGDQKLATPLRVTSAVFLVIPFTSIIRGVFQGLNNMKPTALSQVVEQVVRVSIIITTAVVLVKQGKNLYTIGTGAALGSIIGSIISFLILLYIWSKQQPIIKKTQAIDWLKYIKIIVLYGTFISINHMLLLLLQFTDAFTLVPSLVTYGFNMGEARQWKGIFDRGQPLVQLGVVLGSSLALTLIPSITKKGLEQHQWKLFSHIQSALKFSLYLSSGATVGLIMIFPQANTLLFQNALGSTSLRVLSSTIVFASLVITTATILQGLGHVYITAVFVIIGILAKWLLNSWLVPVYGIFGSSLATVISVMIVFILNVLWLKRVFPNMRLFLIPWRSLGLSLSSMVLFLYVMNQYIVDILQLSTRLDYLVYVLLVIVVGASLYLFMLIRYGGFDQDELDALPFGESLAEVVKEELN